MKLILLFFKRILQFSRFLGGARLLFFLVFTLQFNNSLFAQACNTAWNAATVYASPTSVSHNGRNYTSKWWTQGNQPGSDPSGVWTDNGACSSCTLLPGSIGGAQSILSNTIPSSLINVASASVSGGGAINYQWQKSSDNTTWTDIAGANSATYAPGILTAKTYYRRKVNASGCSEATTSSVLIKIAANLNSDIDGDGILDAVDLDDDNDGILDCVENGFGEVTLANIFNIAGNSNYLSGTEIQLTADLNSQSGSAMSHGKIDFNNDFNFNVELYLGANDGGADGMAIVFHNDPAGINTVGTFGGGLGAQDIQNGIAIEFDTWDNGEVPEDHTHIKLSNTWGDLSPIVKLPNIEDGQWHLVNFKWNASTQTLTYSIDGNLITSYTNDLVSNVFNDESSVYFGFTAGTGGAKNEQKVRFPDSFCSYPMYRDTDNDGVINSLDTDSDGDGCSDAIEGGAAFTNDDLSGDLLSGTVDVNGVPVKAGASGQTIGTSADASIKDIICSKCTNDTDKDGVCDDVDMDDDNDGILDVNECMTSNFKWSAPPTVNGKTATGVINGINYTYTSSINIQTTSSIFAYGTFPGSYNVPNTTVIRNDFVSNNKITFSTPVLNPTLLFSSIGGGNAVPIEFSNPVEVLFQSGPVTINSPTRITGHEGYVILRMNGTYSEISFDYLADETYVNFTFGADFATFCDTDSDGIPNYLDTDSDGDACTDAVEGGSSFKNSDLSGKSLSGGVDANGIPLLATASGQTIGSSTDVNTKDSECCTQPTLTTSDTKVCVGSTITASPTTGGTWTSSNTSVASISNAGVITGVTAGTSTFTFTNTAGCSATTNAVTVNTCLKATIVPDTIKICKGDSTTITAQNVISEIWTGTDVFKSVDKNSIKVSPTNNAIYYIGDSSGYTRGTNIIINGNFESGSGVGFTVDPSCTEVPANSGGTSNQWSIGNGVQWTGSAFKNPNLPMPLPSGVGGKIFYMDGGQTPNIAIYSTQVSVVAGNSYEFSAYVANMFNSQFPCSPAGPPELRFAIDGEKLGYITGLSINEQRWTQFNTTWTSAKTGTINIELLNNNTAGCGNDFAIDAIEFVPIQYTTQNAKDSVVVIVNSFPTVSTSDTKVCVGASITASPTTGGTWTSSNTAVATISNVGVITGVSAGTATFTFTNTAGCSATTNAITVTTCTIVCSSDNDKDGVCDNQDLDDDNDGILDTKECMTSNFYWSTPPTVNGKTATGTINNVKYTYTSSVDISTTSNIYNFGVFPASFNIPNTTSIQNIVISKNTIVFDQPVLNPTLVFASIGGSVNVPIKFSNQVDVLYQYGPVTIDSPTQISAQEGYVVLRMNGTFSQISFDYLADEWYVNFSFGADFSTFCDTDSDGIPNYLDTDSDGDACTDAVEGGSSFKNSDLSGKSLSGGVDANGIPLLATSSGQTEGTSADATKQDVECVLCNTTLPEVNGAASDVFHSFVFDAQKELNETTPVLTAGKQYKFKVTGTWSVWTPDPTQNSLDAAYQYGVGTSNEKTFVLLNGGTHPRPEPNQYNPSHEYWFNYTGTGQALNFTFVDAPYTDNHGTLTYTFYAPVDTIKVCASSTTTKLDTFVKGTSLLWYTSKTGGTGSSNVPTVDQSVAGFHEYWVTQTINGCESERTPLYFKVNTKPVVSLANASICTGDPAVTFDAGAGFASYVWTGNGSGIKQTTSGSAVGTYSVEVSDANGCKNTASANLTLKTTCGCVNDNDKDGVCDEDDLDDDNDGILDETECPRTKVSTSFASTGGTSYTFTVPAADGGFDFDIDQLDNSFNLEINGVKLVPSQIQCEVGPWQTGESMLVFSSDFTEFGFAGNEQVYNIQGNASAPTIRVSIQPNGQVKFMGKRTTASALEPMHLRVGNAQANSVSWKTAGTNQVVLTMLVVGQTKISGTGSGYQLCKTDTDGDGNPNYLDTDSDGDGCSDAVEGGATFKSADLNGLMLSGAVDANGVPVISTATGQTVASSSNASIQDSECTIELIIPDTLTICEGDSITIVGQGITTEVWGGTDAFKQVNNSTIKVSPKADAYYSVGVSAGYTLVTNVVTNSDFETPNIGSGWTFKDASEVSGWKTTSPDNLIEIWNKDMGVTPYSGNQFIELNATTQAALYQDMATTPGTKLQWGFAHRGRSGTETIDFEVGPPGGPYTKIGSYADDASVWGYYTGVYDVPAGQTTTRFYYSSKDPGAAGNFIDAVEFYTLKEESALSGDSVLVQVKSKPLVKLGKDTTICASKSMTLDAGIAKSYLWNTSENTQTISVNTAGNYFVEISNNNGCKAHDTISIRIDPCFSDFIAKDTLTLCEGDSLTINGRNITTQVWGGTDAFKQINDSTIKVSPKADAYYYVGASSGYTVGSNLITNGDFEQGDAGFTSEYSKAAGGMMARGSYAINTSASLHNGGFANCGDHTSGTGKMFITDASESANVKIWCQSINTVANTKYEFATWVTSVYLPNPPILQFQVNGNLLGNVFQVEQTLCNWQQFAATWNSGASTSAEICIINQNIAGSGNDFVMDDISFAPVIETTSGGDTVLVLVKNKPLVKLGNDTILCKGASVNLGTSIAGTYTWSSGASTASIKTGTAGVYHVQVKNTDGCIGKDTIEVKVNELPKVNLGKDTIVCKGASVSLNAQNTGLSYQWNTGVKTQSITVSTSGTYGVVVKDALACIGSDSIKLTVNELPLVKLGNDTTICIGKEVQLSAKNNGLKYLWNTGATTQSIKVSTNGTYGVEVRDAIGCLGSDSMNLKVNELPKVNLGNDTAICKGTSVLLDAKNPGFNFQWNTRFVTQTITASASGTYGVEVRDAIGCLGSDTIKINVHELPKVNLGKDTSLCEWESLVLNAGNPGLSYQWNTGSTKQSITLNNKGTYGVVVSDEIGCKGSDSVNVLVDIVPNPFTVNEFTFCEGDTLVLSPNQYPSDDQFVWLEARNNSDTLLVTQKGTYNGLVISYHCQDTFPVFVEKVDTPDVFIFDINGKGKYCFEYESPLLEIQGPDAGTSFIQWLGTTERGLQIEATKSGWYTAEVSNDFCSSLVQIELEDFCDLQFYIPNAFSPNNDGLNDIFTPKLSNETAYEMLIFNRWGEVIFTSTNPGKGWDGKDKGGFDCPIGVYVYKVYLRNETFNKGETENEQVGTVALIR